MPEPSAPTIITKRLTLRGHRRGDTGDCAAMWGDPVVTRFIGGKPSSASEAWAKLLLHVGHWGIMGFGYWVIHDTGSQRFVGEVGFADFKRELEPSFGGAPEIGWALAPWAHGRGFATEAVRAVVAWGDVHFAGARTVCMIDLDNAASIRVAEKCGYARFARTVYKGAPIELYERRPVMIPS